MIGPALGLVGSLIGGSKKQETTNRVDYQAMVRDAEAAGFNPLTALRNGGAAGFSVTSTPALSSQQMIGQALGTVGNFLTDFDPMADDMRDARYNHLLAQTANLEASTAQIGRSMTFGVPTRTAGEFERRSSGKAGQLGAVQPFEAGEPTVTNPWGDREVDPAAADTDAFETRYGDLLGPVFGVRTYVRDRAHQVKKEVESNTPAYRRKQTANEARKARIRDAAKANARNLGFPAGW